LHGHGSEFVGPNHGHKQVDEEQQGDDAYDNRFHCVLLQVAAEANVKSAYHKKQDDYSDED
jgi:hypothetical protein